MKDFTGTNGNPPIDPNDPNGMTTNTPTGALNSPPIGKPNPWTGIPNNVPTNGQRNIPKRNMPSNGMPSPAKTTDVPDQLINYNEMFKKDGEAMFRDDLIQQTMSVLISRNKPNPLLVGAAGVGKTKIVEHIAWMLANNDPNLPRSLNGMTIYELPLSSVVSGSHYVGDLEEKLEAVLNFAADPINKAILFIDEIHMLMSGNDTYVKIAQILKPALARGNLHVIGATTSQEYSDLIDDPAFARRFSKLTVHELSREQTIEILRLSMPKYILHYEGKVVCANDMLECVVSIADDYAGCGSHRPDNAITLLDRTMATAYLDRRKMEQLLRQSHSNPTTLPSTNITQNQLQSCAKQLASGFATKDALDIDALNVALLRVKGQSNILEIVVKALKHRDMALFPLKKPLTFLFAGNTGTGKTMVAKILANQIMGTKPIILNMAEYHSAADINRIIGASAGYVGYDSHKELPFDILRTNPYQVILLDEFEKADRGVQRLFMSAFEEGYIQDAKGGSIDFSKSVIIATTNAGCKQTEKHVGFIEKPHRNANQLSAELAKWFDPELLNRFSKVVEFNAINMETFRSILADIYATEIARIKLTHRTNLPDTLDDTTLDELSADFNPLFGARPAMRKITEYIEDNI